jgi:hypothetical protein
LDLGRRPAEEGQPDPTRPGTLLYAGQSPDIKVDVLAADGTYQYTVTPGAATTIDYYQFTAQLIDGQIVPTHSRLNLQSHVYVQVHNRGLATANNVRVMLLLATTTVATTGPLMDSLPPLPTDYEQFVRTGLPIATEQWQTIGSTTVHGIRAGYAQIAHFILEADALPTPGQLRPTMSFALVALLHCSDDPFVAEAATALTPGNNRHAAHKQIMVAPFTGQVPTGTPRRRRQGIGTRDWLAEHKVRTGETLSHIAKHYYQSANLWPQIYYANQRLIGENPNFIKQGWILKIPRLL